CCCDSSRVFRRRIRSGSTAFRYNSVEGQGMTPGTSPRPPGTPSMRWTAAAEGIYGLQARLQGWLRRFRLEGPELGRAAAVLYLAGLGVVLTTAWHAPAVAGGHTIAGFPAWHLAFL